MYSYLYDASLAQKKYISLLARIEARLSTLGIDGKITYLSFLKNIKNILREEVRRGAKNLVIVGGDQTVNQVLNLVTEFDLAFGFIPLQASPLGKILGITNPLAACDVLAARKIEKLDLGLVNDYFFLTSFLLKEPVILECDHSYFLSPTDSKTPVQVCNLDFLDGEVSLPQDGLLEVVFTPRPNRLKWWGKSGLSSKFFVKSLKITAKKPVLIKIDANKTLKTPTSLSVLKQKLPFIVGKQRLF